MRIVRRHGRRLYFYCSSALLWDFFCRAIGYRTSPPCGRQDYESLEAFSNILSIVKKNYVEDVETKTLVNGAINGMLLPSTRIAPI